MTAPDPLTPLGPIPTSAQVADRLTPEAKHLLQCASVIGKDFSFAVLEAIADLPDAVARASLSHLQAAELLYETTLFPELEYTFKHALTHEVAYGSLLQATRRTLHARITSAIEYSRDMDLTAWFPLLFAALGAARARGGQVEEGVSLLEESAERARALEILSRQSLRLTWLAEAYLLAGQIDEARATALEAQRLAGRHKEKAYEAWALRMLAETAAHAGAAGEAEAHYHVALARAEALTMRPLGALCHLGLGVLARHAGDGTCADCELRIALTELRELDMRYWRDRAEAELTSLG